MECKGKQPIPTDAQMREAYAKTGLYRLGIPFERAIQCESVRIVLGLDRPPRRGKAKK